MNCQKHGDASRCLDYCMPCRVEKLLKQVETMEGSLGRIVREQDLLLKEYDKRLSDLIENGEWALRGLEQLAQKEAERKETTFELCDYTFAKGLRNALKRAKEGRRVPR